MSEERVEYNCGPVTPDGYMMNGLGHLVPEANVSAVDKLRSDVVRRVVERAEKLRLEVQEFNAWAAGELEAFLEVAAEQHGVQLGGDKGNITLTSYDGALRVVRARADEITFNEAVRVTREMIFKCIEKWTKGANSNLAQLVAKAFETDKHGHLSAARILSLRSIKIDGDEDWDTAMRALDDAIQVIGSKEYLRFYRRDPKGKYRQIALDGR